MSDAVDRSEIRCEGENIHREGVGGEVNTSSRTIQ